jgi:hypothetical protein
VIDPPVFDALAGLGGLTEDVLVQPFVCLSAPRAYNHPQCITRGAAGHL